MKPTTTDLPLHACLNCGRKLDACTSMEGYKPDPGDPTICIDCGHLMVFNDDLTMREINDEEAYLFAADPKILQLQRALKELREQKKARP